MRNPHLDPDKDQLPPEEQQYERALRPKALQDFSGQPKIVENLKIFIQAARQRGEALDHVLLHGPPGLGKTTLSHIVANEMEAELKMTSVLLLIFSRSKVSKTSPTRSSAWESTEA